MKINMELPDEEATVDRYENMDEGVWYVDANNDAVCVVSYGNDIIIATYETGTHLEMYYVDIADLVFPMKKAGRGFKLTISNE